MKRRWVSTRSPGCRGAYGKVSEGARRAGRSLLVIRLVDPRAAQRAVRHPPFRRTDEGQQVVDVGRANLRLDPRHRSAQVGPDPEQDAVGLRERSDALAIEACAAQPDAV